MHLPLGALNHEVVRQRAFTTNGLGARPRTGPNGVGWSYVRHQSGKAAGEKPPRERVGDLAQPGADVVARHPEETGIGDRLDGVPQVDGRPVIPIAG